MSIREDLEKREFEILSPYAAKSVETKGRDRKERPCDIRPAYQRDRDRILHCKSFRRLKQKTQVFLLPQGDHYRTRLTHTLEVSQIARTLAKALHLNEELVEAIALGHDLGHTPFGHAGERALNGVCPGGFRHNEQSVRVVEVLENEGRGLNLTWEVRDGILNHKTGGRPATLEGKVVQLADKMAYIHHDCDDAIRGGIIREEDIPADLRNTLGLSSKERLNTMIHDLIRFSNHRPEIAMSGEIWEAMQDLRKYMFQNVYTNPSAKGEESKAIHMVTYLYDYYLKHTDQMPALFTDRVLEGYCANEQAVCDYIAGMTDSYAVSKFTGNFIPESWKN